WHSRVGHSGRHVTPPGCVSRRMAWGQSLLHPLRFSDYRNPSGSQREISSTCVFWQLHSSASVADFSGLLPLALPNLHYRNNASWRDECLVGLPSITSDVYQQFRQPSRSDIAGPGGPHMELGDRRAILSSVACGRLDYQSLDVDPSLFGL